MLISDPRQIGNRLLAIRKHIGLTQAEVAEAAGLSDRAYADIERGSVNMRIDTALRICQSLHITPDEILTVDFKHMMKSRKRQYCRNECCSKCKCTQKPWIVQKLLCQDHRMIRFAVESMEQACQAKRAKRIRASKQRTVLVISHHKSDHRHCANHQTF